MGLLTHFNQTAELAAANMASGEGGSPFFDLDMLPLGRIGDPTQNESAVPVRTRGGERSGRVERQQW